MSSFIEDGLMTALLKALPQDQAEIARDVCKEWIESNRGGNADDLADLIFQEQCEREDQ